MTVELLQFPYSPYNEKARRGLDLKGIPHRRTNLLPGPHMPRVRKLTGQTATPVVRFGNTYVSGSAQILEELERRYPVPQLFPADPVLRDEAIAIEKRFDEDFTPRIRRAVLDCIIADARYVARLFGEGQSGAMLAFYRLTFPLARNMIRNGNGIVDEASVTDGYRAAEEALDFVSEKTKETGFLAGDSFTIADLTAAASLATCADPPNSTMARPRPMPAKLTEWLERWGGHDGARWVRTIYAAHRHASRSVDGVFSNAA